MLHCLPKSKVHLLVDHDTILSCNSKGNWVMNFDSIVQQKEIFLQMRGSMLHPEKKAIIEITIRNRDEEMYIFNMSVLHASAEDWAYDVLAGTPSRWKDMEYAVLCSPKCLITFNITIFRFMLTVVEMDFWKLAVLALRLQQSCLLLWNVDEMCYLDVGGPMSVTNNHNSRAWILAEGETSACFSTLNFYEVRKKPDDICENVRP